MTTPFSWLILCLAVSGDTPARTLPEPGPLLVTVRPSVQVTTRTVTIGDVADLEGGTAPFRDSVSRLDVAEITGTETKAVVTRKQLLFRLGLAEMPSSLVRVAGESQARITLQMKSIEAAEVLAVAKSALLELLPWPPGQVLIELVQPLTVALPRVAAGEHTAIKTQLHPGIRPPGRVQMDVGLYVQGECRLSLPLYFNVRVCQKVAVCLERVESGEILTEKKVFFEQRPLDARSTQTLSCAAVLGSAARRTLLPGQVIYAVDVQPPVTESGMVVIKAQEAVRLSMKLGSLRATAAGVALQNGNKGQLIQVQNVDSKKVVLGRVVGPSLIEVE